MQLTRSSGQTVLWMLSYACLALNSHRKVHGFGQRYKPIRSIVNNSVFVYQIPRSFLATHRYIIWKSSQLTKNSSPIPLSKHSHVSPPSPSLSLCLPPPALLALSLPSCSSICGWYFGKIIFIYFLVAFSKSNGQMIQIQGSGVTLKTTVYLRSLFITWLFCRVYSCTGSPFCWFEI